MTDMISDLQDINTVTDVGVSLKHTSQNYKEQILTRSHNPDPLAKVDSPNVSITLPTEHNNPKYHPCARELYIPSKYDELLSSSPQSSIVDKFVQSEVQVHELTHDFLTSREEHLYTPSRLISLGATVSWLARKDTNYSVADREFVKRIVNEIRTMQLSEYTQEASAIQNQRRWLKQQSEGGSSINKLVEGLRYNKIIDKLLSGTISRDDIDINSPVHAMSDWLLQNRLNAWDIDILKYSFRFATDNRKSIGPDPILFIASSISSDKINDCSRAQQFEILINEVESSTANRSTIDENPRGDWKIIDKENSVPDSIPTISPNNFIYNVLRSHIKSAIDYGHLERIPILATSYPGIPSNRTLSTIINSMHITTIESKRKFFIDSDVYQWAKGTKVLDIATKLWEMRSNIFLPIVRYLFQQGRTTWSSCVESANSYVDNSDKPYSPLFLDAIGMDDLLPQFDSISQLQKEYYNYYENTINDLQKLGNAIVAEEKKEVRRFFN